MDLRKLKKLIDLVQESGIGELEITEGEERVRISRSPPNALNASFACNRRRCIGCMTARTSMPWTSSVSIA